jgi:hypothetical protein
LSKVTSCASAGAFFLPLRHENMRVPANMFSGRPVGFTARRDW